LAAVSVCLFVLHLAVRMYQ